MSIETRKTKCGVVYDVRYRRAGKSSKHCSKTFKRMADAREFLAHKSKELSDDRLGYTFNGKFDDTTFAEEAEFWIEQMKVELSTGWHRRASAMIHQTLIPKYGHLTPDKFSIPFVRRIQADLKSTDLKTRVGRLSNSSVNRYTEVLCAILNYSAKTQRIPFNPTKGYSKLPDDRVELSYWEPDEVRSFLTFVSKRFPSGHEERWVYVAMLVALNCGARAGELWGLMPQDVKDETLYIKRQWLEIEKRFDLPKGKRNRRAKERLPYRHTVLHQFVRDELLALVGQRQVGPEQTIFYGEGRRPRGHRSFAHRFQRMVRDWGGRRIRFHDLRHTAITLWVHAGINLKVIQDMAGHESITTTMGYVHMVGGSVNKVSRFHLVSDQFEPKVIEGKFDDGVRSSTEFDEENRTASERGVR
jgi:integrase